MNKNNQHKNDTAMSETRHIEGQRETLLLWCGIVTEVIFSAACLFGLVGTGTILFALILARIRAVPIEINGGWIVVVALVSLGPLYALRRHINRRLKEAKHHLKEINVSDLQRNDR
jgi:hypothetical protein